MKARIGTQLNRNKSMQAFLRANGFGYAVPKYIDKGSMRGCWRIYGKPRGGGYEVYERFTPEIREKLISLGFVGFDGQEISQYAGNGGLFHVFVRFKEKEHAKPEEY